MATKSRSRFDLDDTDEDEEGEEQHEQQQQIKGSGDRKKTNLFGIVMSQDVVNSIMAVVGLAGAALGGYALYDNYKAKTEQEALKKQHELERRRQYLLYLQQQEQQQQKQEQEQQQIKQKDLIEKKNISNSRPVIRTPQYANIADPFLETPYASSARIGDVYSEPQYYQPPPLHHSPATGAYDQSVPITNNTGGQSRINMSNIRSQYDNPVTMMPYESGTARYPHPSIDPSKQPMHPSQLPIKNGEEQQQQQQEEDQGQQNYEEAEATQEYPSDHPTQEEIDELYRNINGTTQ